MLIYVDIDETICESPKDRDYTKAQPIKERIEKINKNDPYKLVVDTVQSAKSKAAKIFFNLIKGKSKVLDIRVRYKGTFTAKPQFQGGMTSEFKLLVDKECGSS